MNLEPTRNGYNDPGDFDVPEYYSLDFNVTMFLNQINLI